MIGGSIARLCHITQEAPAMGAAQARRKVDIDYPERSLIAALTCIRLTLRHVSRFANPFSQESRK